MTINQAHDFFIQLHLTERCNLRCTHCYQTGAKTDEMSLSEIKDIAAETAEMLKVWSDIHCIEFSPSFNVTGGEPLLRRDLYGIIEEIGSRGFEIYLLSNGTLIDQSAAKTLARLGVKGVQVSIEGPREIHERIRGKGSFTASLRGVKHLLEAGLTVTLNVTLSELNADHFAELVTLSSSLGVQRLGFSRLVPSGRGAGLVDKMISKQKIKEIYEGIFSLSAGGLEIVTGDPVAVQMSSDEGEDAGAVATAGCAAGLSGLTILPDGTLTPCRRLFIPLGNVRKDGLREVWATSEVLGLLRDRNSYKGRCGRCERWSRCRGCRAIAYAYSLARGESDFLAEDPQCFIRD
jgi:radical SAM protein with 4Fe4S-binding SPASM domain